MERRQRRDQPDDQRSDSQTHALTFDHSAQQAWDGLDLRHIVQEEVTITCCIGILTLTEDVPQVSAHSRILHHLGLSTCFQIVNPQSSVSHQTHPENGDEESFGVGEALQLSQQLRSGSCESADPSEGSRAPAEPAHFSARSPLSFSS